VKDEKTLAVVVEDEGILTCDECQMVKEWTASRPGMIVLE
jgi:hypothetical protein